MNKFYYYIRAKSREGKTIFLLTTWSCNRTKIGWTTKINDPEIGSTNWRFESLEGSQAEYHSILKAHLEGHVQREAIDKPYSWY